MIETFKMKIILVGFMASGKTTLGISLAEKLNLSFIDTDQIIEKQTGKTVSQIFEINGESLFRELELECIASIKELENYVLSVGGGLPCYNNMMDELNNMGLTIFLDVDSDQIYKRLQSELFIRPLLKELAPNELKSYTEEFYAKRREIYNKAKLVVYFNSESVQESLEKLINLINLHQTDL